MKHLVIASILLFLVLSIYPRFSYAESVKKSDKVLVVKTTSAEDAMANALITRLNQINAMDKSNLSSDQKHELRRQVKSIHNQLRYVHGGIYISGGALLIIIILLIIFL